MRFGKSCWASLGGCSEAVEPVKRQRLAAMVDWS